jgi:thiamine biosynthesis lipoprotein
LLEAGGTITAIGKPLSGGTGGQSARTAGAERSDNSSQQKFALDRTSWAIGVYDPDLDIKNGTQHYLDVVYIADQTVSCSGAYQRYYTVNGETYGHIIDPATLMPPRRFTQVAVIHPSAGMADILSTALFILPIAQGRELAEKYGAAAFWIDMDGKWEATAGYREISQEYTRMRE